MGGIDTIVRERSEYGRGNGTHVPLVWYSCLTTPFAPICSSTSTYHFNLSYKFDDSEGV